MNSAKTIARTTFQYLPIIFAIIIVVCGLSGLWISLPQIIMFGVWAIAIGGGLFLTYAGFPRLTTLVNYEKYVSQPDHSLTSTKLLEIGIFVGIMVFSGVVVLDNSPGLADIAYLLVIVVSLLIAYRIIRGALPQWSIPLVLLEIICLTIAFRGALWFSYSSYGWDSLYHVATAGYIQSTGNLLPAYLGETHIGHYRLEPGSHVFTAVGSLLSGFESKRTFFLTAGVAYVLMSITVFTTTTFLLSHIIDANRYSKRVQRVSLLTTLSFGFSVAPMIHGAIMYAQTLAEALFVCLFFLIVIIAPRFQLTLKIYLPILVVGTASIVTQNLQPMILIGIGVIYACIKGSLQVANQISLLNRDSFSDIQLGNFISPVVLVAVIATVYYWLLIGIFRAQFVRIMLIASIGSGSAQQSLQTANAGAPPTINLFGIKPPGILLWGAPLLIVGVICTAVGLLTIQRIISHNDPFYSKIPTESFNIGWLTFCLFLFGSYAVAYVVGGQGPVIRAFDAVTFLLLPAMAFLFDRFQGMDSPTPIRTVFLIIIICGIITSGILSPRVAISQRDVSSFSPVASESETSAVNYAMTNLSDREIATDKYLRFYSRTQKLNQGKNPSSPLITTLQNRDPTESRHNFNSLVNNKSNPILYRQSFSTYYHVKRPQTFNKVYSGGNTSIFSPN